MLLNGTSPQFIDTVEDFERVIKPGTSIESDTLEFKEDVGGWRASKDVRAKNMLEFARDVSQFANASGGCLVFGIEDGPTMPDCRRVAGAVRPLTECDAKVQWMAQAISAHLVPNTFSYRVACIQTSQGIVVAVNVPPHHDTVLVWNGNSHTMECVVRRISHKEYLNPNEMIAHMMNHGRAARVLLTRLYEECTTHKQSSEVALASGLWVRGMIEGDTILKFAGTGAQQQPLVRCPERISLSKVFDHEFELCCEGSSRVNIPYGLVKEAWRASDGKIGLLLGAKLVRDGRMIYIEV
jgi:hypothetical protein